MKILSIIESAYRATLEEQDDTIVWVNTALKGAGAPVDVLLIDNAVNYAVKGQDASGLAFGERRQKHSPVIDQDLARMMSKGIVVYLCRDDAVERGIEDADLIDGIQSVTRAGLADLYDSYDHVWHW